MDREIEYDVCIVGASIAGNYLCYLLSKTNLNIVVIEEHNEIGVPLQCAGIISQKLIKLVCIPDKIILNRVRVAKIVSPNEQFIKISGNEEPYVIDRTALDRFFYEKATKNEKIKYLLGEKFISFKHIKKRNKQALLIKTSNHKIKTKILVGCDGPLSTVAKSLCVENNNLYATQIRVPANFEENEVVMYFNPRWKELFGWIVPEGNGVFRIGMACSQNLVKNYQYFLKKINIDFTHKIDQQGGLIPFGMMNRVAFDNVLLLGDSGCQVKATTGGGIINLLTAAKFAAFCIKKCHMLNDFSRKIIKKYYEIPCRLAIGKELKIHYLIRMILERLDNNDFIKLFKIIRHNKIENLINIYGDMDFPRVFILKLLKNPIVISFLVKFTLKNPLFLIKLFRLITH
ncbi:MAG: geranylgeranyl reductase family protein [Promethearchaeota archaeon]